MTVDPRGDVLFETEYMVVLSQRNGQVSVRTGQDPWKNAPTVVDARELRDALDEHLGGEEDTDEVTTTITVDADVKPAQLALAGLTADVDETTEAIENLQETLASAADDVDVSQYSSPWPERLGLEEDDDAAENPHRDGDFGDDDYGTPAPSPADVQERLEDQALLMAGIEDPSEMTPVEKREKINEVVGDDE